MMASNHSGEPLRAASVKAGHPRRIMIGINVLLESSLFPPYHMLESRECQYED
jgi:hypothetical protein